MKWSALLVLLSGCALQTWSAPQPYFSTKQPADAFARAVAATQKNCGGVRDTNEESGLIIAPWIAWNTGDGLVLTQCMVSLLNGDEHVRDVRVTFAARKCPLSDMDADLFELAKTCEVLELVPDQVKNGLEVTAKAMEMEIAR
jgi:hypothetical protein